MENDQTPLISTGQGDYRRDVYADKLRDKTEHKADMALLFLLALICGFTLLGASTGGWKIAITICGSLYVGFVAGWYARQSLMIKPRETPLEVMGKK